MPLVFSRRVNLSLCLSGVPLARDPRVSLTDYAHGHARGSGCGSHDLIWNTSEGVKVPMRMGVIDDACTSSIHTLQTVGQCITRAVHSEWSTHYTILHGLVLYTIAIQHTGTK